ncbi:MAG: hypothetical protein HY700_02175 [Gemmatimonadetes bacterium]|nr:hypothetical protein [Gemmatimonadota bacterium]
MNWFNAVDATYRNDLKEVNELNFARFDAKLEQRFAESDAKWEHRMAESDAKWERRMVEFGAKLGSLDAKLDAKVEALSESVDKRLAEAEGRLLRWMAGLLIPTLLGVVGIAVGVFLRR